MPNANTLHRSNLAPVDPSRSPTSREHPTEALDFFGAITRLIEQGLDPEDLENLPESSQELPESSVEADAFEPVEDESIRPCVGDSSTLKSNLQELERAIEEHGQQLELTRSQSAEASLAAETAEAVVAQLREDVRAYEEKACQDEDALREGNQQLAEIREQFESFKREIDTALAKEGAAHKRSLEEFRDFRRNAAGEATLLRESERALIEERWLVASLKREVEALRKKQEEERRAKNVAEAELANTRDALEVTKGALSSERERIINLLREKEATCHMLQVLQSENESTRANLAKAFVEIRVSQENADGAIDMLKDVQNVLANERRRVNALEQEMHAVLEEKELPLANLAKAREECREARVENEKNVEDLRKTREALAAEREISAISKQEAEAACKKENDVHATMSHMVSELGKCCNDFEECKQVLAAERERSLALIQQSGAAEKEVMEARAARERAEATETKVKGEVSILREECMSMREAKKRAEECLVAEREMSATSKQEAEAACKKENDMQATMSHMVSELAKYRNDFEESKQILAAERERSLALIQQSGAAEKEVMEARAARERAEATETKVKGEVSILREECMSMREAKKRAEECLVAEREMSAISKQEAEAACKKEDDMQATMSHMVSELAKYRNDFEECKQVLAAERERSLALIQQSGAAEKEVMEARAAREGAEAAETKVKGEVSVLREECMSMREAKKRAEECLVAEREMSATSKQEAEAACKKGDDMQATMSRMVSELAKYRNDFEESKQILAAEREHSLGLIQQSGAAEKEVMEARAAREEAEAAETKVKGEVSVLREECMSMREAKKRAEECLVAEREMSAILKQEAEAACKKENDMQATMSRMVSELAKYRNDFEESKQILAAEREHSLGLIQQSSAAEKEVMEARAAREGAEAAETKVKGEVSVLREECMSMREAKKRAEEYLVAEREMSAISKQEAEAACKKEDDMQATMSRMVSELAKYRNDFEESKQILAAEREHSLGLIQQSSAAEKEVMEARAAREGAEAAETKVKGEVRVLREECMSMREAKKRAEECLVAERKQFAEYRKVTEAKMKLLQEEATRVGGLEDELARKNLRLKQKEAEARALATDGKVVRGLRESLSCKDIALDELRQELGNLRKASAVVAAKQFIQPQQREEQRASTNTTVVAKHSTARSSPAQNMSFTYSFSSSDSLGGLSSGLKAIMEKESTDEAAKNGKPKAEKYQESSQHQAGDGDFPLPSPCGSQKREEVCGDEDESPKSTPELKLDRVHFEKDDDSEGDNGDILAGEFPAPEHASSFEWMRDSRIDGGGAGRAAAAVSRGSKVSFSLSPASRCGAMSRASVVPASKSLSPILRRAARASLCPDFLRSSQLKMPAANLLSTPQRKDPLAHGLGEDGNTVVLELGAWKVRAGVIARKMEEDEDGKSFFDDFPCCLARPIREGADLDEILNGASSLAAPMYDNFRETGIFVGGDAWYCCHDHPSIALRSKLELSCPTQRGERLGRDDANMLMDHAFGLVKQEASSSRTLLTYKPTATSDEVVEMASVLLEAHQVPSIRLVNEAEVTALAVGVSTGVVVDIGESGFSVTPVFDGCPVATGARWEACGGADITAFLDTMLHSRTNQQFNQMTDKRRLELSRQVKQELCYVALDFNVEVEEHGSFCQKVMRVYNGARVSPRLSQYEAHDTDTFFKETEEDESITASKSFTLKSGEEMVLSVGRERFHAPEILFTPSVWTDAVASKGLGAVVMDAVAHVDSDTRAEMLGDVVIVGGSASIEGLGERLEEELKAMLPREMANRVDVRVPSPAELQHRNPLSRGSPSAVAIGCEILLQREGSTENAWITSINWAEHPGVLTAALAPFVRG